MNIKFTMICILTSLYFIGNCHASHIISFFFKPYPAIMTQKKALKQVNKLKRFKPISYYTIKNFFKDPLVAGIIATYAGYITVSTTDGQILFPNKQIKPSLYLIITKRLTPITMAAHTIHHWELEKGTHTATYLIERKQDEETEQFYWQVQKTTISEDSIIPTNSISILAKPQKVYVPTGITLTKKNQNFLLPDLYAKRGIMKVTNTLYMLKLKHFFKPVKRLYKQKNKYLLEQVT